MKKTFRTMLVAFMAVTMVAFVGCDKEDDGNGGNGNGTEQPTPNPNPNPNPGPTINLVDLGLPSGLLWAECNVGATTPEGYGDYYAWGETQTKTVYNWGNYRYGHNSHELTKYCDDPNYGLNGYTDDLTTLEPGDDAATANLGNGFRIPTKTEWEEMVNNTTHEWTTQNGVYGWKFTSTNNGKSIFLPAAGETVSALHDVGEGGHYWTSTLGADGPNYAWQLAFTSTQLGGDLQPVTRSSRYGGITIRAVREPEAGWVDLGLPSGLLWAECNLGATTPEGYGDYFAWGETQPKSDYSWSTYAYCTVNGGGSVATLTKYNTSTTYGTPDNLTTLVAADDAATVNMGDGARTPTKAEWEELVNNTTAVWTTQNGVAGRKFIAVNGNSIFLPAAGFRFYTAPVSSVGTDGNYCSSSLDTDNPTDAHIFSFDEDSQNMGTNNYRRYYGRSVRAVRPR